MSRADAAMISREAGSNYIRSIKVESTSDPSSGFLPLGVPVLVHRACPAFEAVSGRLRYNALCVSSILSSHGQRTSTVFASESKEQQQPREKAMISRANET